MNKEEKNWKITLPTNGTMPVPGWHNCTEVDLHVRAKISVLPLHNQLEQLAGIGF